MDCLLPSSGVQLSDQGLDGYKLKGPKYRAPSLQDDSFCSTLLFSVGKGISLWTLTDICVRQDMMAVLLGVIYLQVLGSSCL